MPSEANLRAAREVVASRARHARGLHRTSSSGMTQPLSLRAACSRHPGSSVASIQRIVTRIETGFTPQQVGRPRVLTDEEDEAIVAFVIWMERSGFPASKPEIEDAATTLRQRRNPDADPVSKMWYARFRDDHPELEQAFLKAAEQSRSGSSGKASRSSSYGQGEGQGSRFSPLPTGRPVPSSVRAARRVIRCRRGSSLRHGLH
ncbi:hypothetical protein NW757_14890 [Fusarium falciforme]|nr:hypothetical protein NW757_14890 [Fusarium falciforme]